MKIAIPLVHCRLASRFGHCESFAIFDVNAARKEIISRQDIPAPAHQPDSLPAWLAQRGVRTVIAGGMGRRAQELLSKLQITALVGAEKDVPEKLVGEFLDEKLDLGENICDGCYTVKISLTGKGGAKASAN